MIQKYSKGINLYKKSSKVIPGGVQLLSKRPEIFLPDYWPSYYKSAKGSEVTTLDGKKLYDFTNCSVGMCPLGYSNPKINKKVIDVINKGNTTTLNSYLEYECAKIILDLHKWADMARFTKSGGEAMSVAVRIARAYKGKDKVLFCGYHGWHDWYISANLKGSNKLDKHLLPGVSSKGVPKALKGLTIPFEFNNTIDFKKKLNDNLNSISCIVLEPARAFHSSDLFLKTIRSLSSKYDIPLIIDEITLGWHCTLGGYHKIRNLKPDIAVFSKGTTNGFPLGVVIGKKKIMKATSDTFISSAYWTENIGFAAAIATIKYMKEKKVAKTLIKQGKKVKEIWRNAAKLYHLPIKITGMDSLPSFAFNQNNSDEIITFFTQEMLKEGILAHGSCYIMTTHSDFLLKKYAKAVNKVFKKISKIQISHNGRFKKYLKGRVKFAKFKNPV